MDFKKHMQNLQAIKLRKNTLLIYTELGEFFKMETGPINHTNTVNAENNVPKTKTGKYCAGMKLEQIQGDNYASNKARKQFEKIDKNKDGVLSSDEIILERKKETKRAGVLFGVYALLIGSLWGGYMKNGKKIEELIYASLCTGIGLTLFSRLNKEIKENKELEAKFSAQV